MNLFVLIIYTVFHDASWSVSGAMTQSQCEAAKQHVLSTVRPADWGQREIVKPLVLECVPVGKESEYENRSSRP